MKICSKCKNSKTLESFHKMSRSKDGRQAMCITCKAEAHQLDGDRRRGMISARNARVRSTYRDRIVEYFKDHPCVDCGNTDIRVLEFDHLGDKMFNVSAYIKSACNWERIENEIKKCEIRCANCHKIKTWERLGNTWHNEYIDLVSPLVSTQAITA